MGFSVYLPALALNAVTPIKLQWSIILTSGVCTMYTAFVSICNYMSMMVELIGFSRFCTTLLNKQFWGKFKLILFQLI